MWQILQQARPDDYVLATGINHTVREFAERAFAEVGLELAWQGAGVDEIGIDRASGRVLIRVDPRLFRPSEVDTLLGDASKARALLGWEAQMQFPELVKVMVASDLEEARRLR
jgi:GDPmannose 4,6-dehydratase